MKKTKKLTVSALMAALAFVFLYLGSILPTGQAGFAALACLPGFVLVIYAGLFWSAGQYVVCAALALLLLPDKSAAILYAVFFGYYPIVKSLAERCKSRVIEWIVKLAVFNAALTAALFLFTLAFLPERLSGFPVWGVYLLLNIVFVAFDYGLTRVIALYMARVGRHIK